jgi:protein-arginine kinase
MSNNFMIQTFRLSISRNLDGIQFAPAISTNEREDVLKIVQNASKNFEDKFAGTLYKYGATDYKEKVALGDALELKQ